MKKISILGSTGSIGTQTLDVIAYHHDQFQVEALAAGTNIDLLIQQAITYRPKLVSVATAELASFVRDQLPSEIQVAFGEDGALAVAAHNDAEYVVTAMVGSVGLKPTLAAIEAGKTIGLANKETLVTAGHLVTKAAASRQVALIPIDSEHSAIYQCLNGESLSEIDKIILTASGGSFRDFKRDELRNVTVEQALKHPNWSMGAKITIDSATMANKGFEVIEAHWLFGLAYDQIDVLVHPESVIHSMVEFRDGSIIAQLGTPDMRVPIQYALTYPNRLHRPSERVDFVKMGQLGFRAMDYERYPILRLAYEAGREGGTMTAVLNAANEVAVARFLNREIGFMDIETIIERVIDKHQVTPSPQLDVILEADSWARRIAQDIRM
jgi:1-deoxy-D-xylulose-5-phosphate reductoisomerase